MGPGRRALEVRLTQPVPRQDVLDDGDVDRIARVAGAGDGNMRRRKIHSGVQGDVSLEGLGGGTDVERSVEPTGAHYESAVGVDNGYYPVVILLDQAGTIGHRQCSQISDLSDGIPSRSVPACSGR